MIKLQEQSTVLVPASTLRMIVQPQPHQAYVAVTEAVEEESDGISKCFWDDRRVFYK
jgi:hypothetical protein